MGLHADFSGAFAKTAMLKRIPQAAKLQATRWATETERDLKRSAASMQKAYKYPGGKKTSQMGRSIGSQVQSFGTNWIITVGTGLRGAVTSKYAKLQDEGGVTHPTVTPRMRKWAWWAYNESGNEKYKGIALTKKSKLTVNIPASKWFTSVIERREPILRELMDPEVVKNIASQMSGGAG